MVEREGRLGRKNRKGFYDYPENGAEARSGRASPTSQPTQLDPRRRSTSTELKQRLLVDAGARGGAHRRGGRHHRSARGRCRLDPRLRLRPLSPAARSPTSTAWARRPSSRSARSLRRSTARASPPPQILQRDGDRERHLLRRRARHGRRPEAALLPGARSGTRDLRRGAPAHHRDVLLPRAARPDAGRLAPELPRLAPSTSTSPST